MPFYLYGGKNGISTLIDYVKMLCHLYMKFQSPIQAFINASPLTTEQKAQVIDWLNTGVVVCGLLTSTIEIVPEPLG